MPVVCRDYDLLFSHVPKTGGTFVERVLFQYLGGKRMGRKHHTFRSLRMADPPSVRVFVVREPLSWYQSYWAFCRQATKRGSAWPIWEAGESGHPTYPIDRRGGAPTFDRFIEKMLDEFPNGFVRSMYCNFLNGCTHALHTTQLRGDLEALLELVGFEHPRIVEEMPDANVTGRQFKDRVALPPHLEELIREVDNLDGLAIPYISPR